MKLPQFSGQWMGLIAGAILCATAVADALLFHRATGLNAFDEGLIGAGAAAMGIGGAYWVGLKTPTP